MLCLFDALDKMNTTVQICHVVAWLTDVKAPSHALLLQIEVLAPAFKTEGKEINARPHDFDFDGGEDPNFSGFHKIEQLLYRDGTLSGAQPVAAKLQASLLKSHQAVLLCCFYAAAFFYGIC